VPKLRSKTEVLFPPQMEEKIELFQKELSDSMGRKVSKSRVVVEIVELFFKTAEQRNRACKEEVV
jgi:hypothetical protein